MRQGEGMAPPPAHVWPTLTYEDAPAAIAFLKALGFEEHVVHADPDDPSIIHHAQLSWPAGGAVMLGSAGRDREHDHMTPGVGSTFTICEDPDALFETAKAAGATVIREVRDEDYGSRGFGVEDAEGNAWWFGTWWED